MKQFNNLAILKKILHPLTLYWTVQNLLTILQTKLTKLHDEKKAAAGSNAIPIKVVADKPKKK